MVLVFSISILTKFPREGKYVREKSTYLRKFGFMLSCVFLFFVFSLFIELCSLFMLFKFLYEEIIKVVWFSSICHLHGLLMTKPFFHASILNSNWVKRRKFLVFSPITQIGEWAVNIIGKFIWWRPGGYYLHFLYPKCATQMVSNFYTLSSALVELRCEDEHFAAEPTIWPIEVVP